MNKKSLIKSENRLKDEKIFIDFEGNGIMVPVSKKVAEKSVILLTPVKKNHYN